MPKLKLARLSTALFVAAELAAHHEAGAPPQVAAARARALLNGLVDLAYGVEVQIAGEVWRVPSSSRSGMFHQIGSTAPDAKGRRGLTCTCEAAEKNLACRHRGMRHVAEGILARPDADAVLPGLAALLTPPAAVAERFPARPSAQEEVDALFPARV
jgi:hypothetical protein